ncbi:MAG: hypothetical protein KGJ78_05230 [Alphaproteobacteria bacterium]|nr:hypothetical protein [Alphaproteobacteria bacterium]
MVNRKYLYLAAALLATGAMAAASDFNPQPDPPGRHLNTVNKTMQTQPPDPCMAGQQHAMMHKMNHGDRQAPAKPMMACGRNGAHQLNPQPLPPG